MPRDFSNQRGGSKLQAVIALLVVVAVAVAGFRIIPVYIRAYELRDFMRSQAKFAGVEFTEPETIRENVYRKAQQLELPIAKNQISAGSVPGGARVTVRFSVPVDLVVMTHSFNFEFEGDTRSAY